MKNIELKDIEELCQETYIPWEKLKNKTIFVTGATGLIGSQIVKTLVHINKAKALGMGIVAHVRNEKKVETCLGDLRNSSQIEIVVSDINEEIKYNGEVNYIIHGASVTSSKDFVSKPVETIWTATNGTNNILKFAQEKEIESMVYLSSLEIYGTPQVKDSYITEESYGAVNPLNPRSSYPESKRMVECLCSSYCSEYNIPVKIARLAQTFGPGVDIYSDNRVFAQFARSVLNNKNIVLNTDGSTTRSYCYNQDAVAGILTILLKGRNGEAYNIANEKATISIREMAEMISNRYPEHIVNVEIQMEDINSFGYLPSFKMKLSSRKLESLGWIAKKDIGEMFDYMICSIKEQAIRYD